MADQSIAVLPSFSSGPLDPLHELGEARSIFGSGVVAISAITAVTLAIDLNTATRQWEHCEQRCEDKEGGETDARSR